MKDRAELYQEIKKFFKQEAEPLLKKYEKERKEDMLPVLLQRTCIITALLGFLGGFIFPIPYNTIHYIRYYTNIIILPFLKTKK